MALPIMHFTLCMDHAKRDLYLKWCFQRLLARGHSSVTLNWPFKQAITCQSQNTKTSEGTSTDFRKLFFHVTYHNRGPTTGDIENHFEKSIIQPFGETRICAIKNSRNCSINPKLTVSYHRTKNLDNLLSPQKLGMELEAAMTDLQPSQFSASCIFNPKSEFFYTPTLWICLLQSKHFFKWT